MRFLCPSLRRGVGGSQLIGTKGSDNFHDNINSFKIRLTSSEQNYPMAPRKSASQEQLLLYSNLVSNQATAHREPLLAEGGSHLMGLIAWLCQPPAVIWAALDVQNSRALLCGFAPHDRG